MKFSGVKYDCDLSMILLIPSNRSRIHVYTKENPSLACLGLTGESSRCSGGTAMLCLWSTWWWVTVQSTAFFMTRPGLSSVPISLLPFFAALFDFSFVATHASSLFPISSARILSTGLRKFSDLCLDLAPDPPCEPLEDRSDNLKDGSLDCRRPIPGSYACTSGRRYGTTHAVTV